jgi:hypothetical protein
VTEQTEKSQGVGRQTGSSLRGTEEKTILVIAYIFSPSMKVIQKCRKYSFALGQFD